MIYIKRREEEKRELEEIEREMMEIEKEKQRLEEDKKELERVRTKVSSSLGDKEKDNISSISHSVKGDYEKNKNLGNEAQNINDMDFKKKAEEIKSNEKNNGPFQSKSLANMD